MYISIFSVTHINLETGTGTKEQPLSILSQTQLKRYLYFYLCLHMYSHLNLQLLGKGGDYPGLNTGVVLFNLTR